MLMILVIFTVSSIKFMFFRNINTLRRHIVLRPGRQSRKREILKSLQRARCESLNVSFELLKRLLVLRRTASTASNDTSSRSHLVIRIILPLHNSNSITFGDLAGSESLKFTSAAQMMLMLSNNNNNSNNNDDNNNEAFQLKQETKNINVSLLALKKVVRSLRTNSDHIPFKDSMLTTVLEPCFTTATVVASSTANKNNNNRQQNQEQPISP